MTMYGYVTARFLLYTCILEVFVLAIPPQWDSVSSTPTPTATLAGMSGWLGLSPNIIPLITTAPTILPTHHGLIKREVGNDFCGWIWGQAGRYFKCDGKPGLCLYDPAESAVACDIGLGLPATTCDAYSTSCDDSCRLKKYQNRTVPCPSPSQCMTATFPSNYRFHMCIPPNSIYIETFMVSWSYTGMDTVVHLPRWRGDDGLLSYGTVVPNGVATPTGSFTGGRSLDVYCCDQTSETMTTSSTTSSSTFELPSTTSPATSGTFSSSSTSVGSSSTSTSSSNTSSRSSGLSTDSIIGLAVGIPASIAGIAGVCVAIYFGRRRRAAASQ